MAAAAALLVGGVAMGMAVGSTSASKPASVVAAVAPLPPQNSPPAANAAPQPLQQTAAPQPTEPPVFSNAWQPPQQPTSSRPVLAPPPPPGAPIAFESASRSTAPQPPETLTREQQPAPQDDKIQAGAAQDGAPVQLAAAPTPPPSLTAAAAVGPQAWRARAVAPPAGAKPPYVAIVIDDAGLDHRNTERVLRLPGPITVSFMSYAKGLAEQSAAARAAGHEVMLHLPMEPLDAKRNHPGPNALWLGLDEAELKRRLQWNLGRFDGYVGINNHMGSRFTADVARMALVMEEIGRRQVYWLDSLTGPRSVGAAVARKGGIDTVERDLFLDDERSPGIQHELAAMERIATARGDVIAIGHPHTSTLKALEVWIAGAKEKGFSLVPVSTVLLRRQQQER